MTISDGPLNKPQINQMTTTATLFLLCPQLNSMSLLLLMLLTKHAAYGRHMLKALYTSFHPHTNSHKMQIPFHRKGNRGRGSGNLPAA